MDKQGLLADKKVLVIDPEEKKSNDRTWGFWAEAQEDFSFKEITYRQWQYADFLSDDYKDRLDLDPYRYFLIRGIDFYEFVLDKLHQNSHVEFLLDRVEGVENINSKVKVTTAQKSFLADYVFDSRFEKTPVSKKDIHLYQPFLGWVIQTPFAKFDTQKITLFDFTIPQKEHMQFVYVLPFSETEALVEYTFFSTKIPDIQVFKEGLQHYCANNLQLDKYAILEEEYGVIPMSNHRPKIIDGNIVKIGTAAGQTKTSTGYTFDNIQRNSQAITQSIKQYKTPLKFKKPSNRFHLYDSIFMKVIESDEENAHKIFSNLFKKNEANTILKFLREDSSFIEEFQIMNNSPKPTFIKAMIQALRRL